MEDFLKMTEIFNNLHPDVRNDFIIQALADGKLNYQTISDGYIKWLEKVRKRI